MCLYLCTKFQFSNIILTSFEQGWREGGGREFFPPPSQQNEPLKNPPQLGLRGKNIYYKKELRWTKYVHIKVAWVDKIYTKKSSLRGHNIYLKSSLRRQNIYHKKQLRWTKYDMALEELLQQDCPRLPPTPLFSG